MRSLVGITADIALPHGPSKRYVDEFLWHSPHVGVVASYTPKADDVKDHFGVFRGVDQLESMAQATVVAGNGFITCQEKGIGFEELYELYTYALASFGPARYYSFVREGETFISVGVIRFCRFRQMEVNGRLYRVPPDLDLKAYFERFSEEQLKAFDIDQRCQCVSEFNDVVGKGIKRERFNLS